MGLVAIFVLGETGSGSGSPTLLPNRLELPAPKGGDVDGGPLSVAALEKSLKDDESYLQDPEILKWINAVSKAKERAIEAEEFNMAKELKHALDHIKEKSTQIAVLEKSKKVCISKEDFDQAKLHKDEVDLIKNTLMQKIASDRYTLDDNGRLAHPDMAILSTFSRRSPQKDLDSAKDAYADNDVISNDGNAKPSDQPTEQPLPKQKAPPVQMSHVELENRPIQPRKDTIKLEEFDIYSTPPGLEPISKGGPKVSVPAVEKKAPPPKKAVPPPTEKIQEEAADTQIDNQQQKFEDDANTLFAKIYGCPFEMESEDAGYHGENQELYKVFGHPILDCVMSKNFAKKEWALQSTQEKYTEALRSPGNKEMVYSQDEVIKAGYAIVNLCIGDPREKVSIGCLQFWKVLVEYQQKSEAPAQAVKRTDMFFQALLSKPSDMNVRIRQVALETITFVCDTYPQLMTHVFKNPSMSNPKLLRTRLEISSHILENVKSEHSVPYPTVLKWATGHLSNQSGEVRDAACKAIVSIYTSMRKKGKDINVARREVLNHCGKSKPQILQVLESGFDQYDGNVPHEPMMTDATSRKSSIANAKNHALRKSVISESENEGSNMTEKLGASPSKIPRAKNSKTFKNVAEDNSASAAPGRKSSRKGSNVKRKSVGLKNANMDAALSNQWNIDKTCIFCEEVNPNFNEHTLDLHYWNDCKMLTKCIHCGHVTEIAVLSDHYLNDCDKRDVMKACPTCLLAIPQEQFDQHVKQNKCQKAGRDRPLCPLCSLQLPAATDIEWKNHLLVNGCPGSSRSRIEPNPLAETKATSGGLTEQKKSMNPFKWLTRKA